MRFFEARISMQLGARKAGLPKLGLQRRKYSLGSELN